MKLYLAGPMFTAAEQAHNLRLAAKLRDHGFAVFCPNESEPNSDKTRTDITPRLIYDVDIEAVESCNVLICQVSEDSGTNWEAGYMNCLSRRVDPGRYYGVIGLATDIRLRTPPHRSATGWRTRRCTSTPSSSAVTRFARGLPRRRLHDRAAAGDSPGAGGRSMTDLDASILNIEASWLPSAPCDVSISRSICAGSTISARRRCSASPRPMTLEQETAWYEQAAVDDGEVGFTIYERATGRPIGNCGLRGGPGQPAHNGWHHDRRAGRAGCGYGNEAMRLLLDYAFTVLGLHNVMLTVVEYNGAGRRC